MPTDDERRDVARRLRELDDSELQVYDMTYFAIQRAVGGEGDQYPDGRELADRLANLIEPGCDRDTPQKAAEEMFGKMCHATKEETDAYEAMLKSKSVEIHPVDRDALLELADEMGRVRSRCEYCNKMNDCDWTDETMCLESYVDDYARRIREALGVTADADA